MRRIAAVGLLGLCVLSSPVAGQNTMDDVQITTQQLTDGVYMLMGQGGNIGVSVGPDGVFVIDDQFAPLTEKILAAIAAITSESDYWILSFDDSFQSASSLTTIPL